MSASASLSKLNAPPSVDPLVFFATHRCIIHSPRRMMRSFCEASTSWITPCCWSFTIRRGPRRTIKRWGTQSVAIRTCEGRGERVRVRWHRQRSIVSEVLARGGPTALGNLLVLGPSFFVSGLRARCSLGFDTPHVHVCTNSRSLWRVSFCPRHAAAPAAAFLQLYLRRRGSRQRNPPVREGADLEQRGRGERDEATGSVSGGSRDESSSAFFWCSD